ncbi:MAG: hypothetical protein MK105_11515 [Crocinitomicaceae bacterium]|nr:hypothetical protein [Crocinitomicaceae bacterium]
MFSIKPPKSRYSDIYDISRFNLIWNLSIILVVLLTILSIINITNDKYTSTTNIAGVGIGLAALYILNKTREHRFVSIFVSLGTFALVCSAFFLIDNVIHYTTSMWSMMCVLFTFLMLGRYWGYGFLLGHFIVLSIYYHFCLANNIENLPKFESEDLWNFTLETAVVSLTVALILTRFILTTRHNEKRVNKINQELTDQNAIIKQQNEEKEVMLKEIHHRVKNNLQVITSLLRLQSYEGNHELQDSFSEAINRVKSMALIHEKMYKSSSLAHFDIEAYLTSLTHDLKETYTIEKSIDINITSEIKHISSKSIVPISLIFNELISNSIKHAFEHLEKGKIEVLVSAHKDKGKITLIYKDNGKWKESESNSFGMELIETMTEQLDGTISIIKKDKTEFTFSLKV